ncbi:MAG: hypothetical protein RIB98_02920 [Acidimicrobiales bacterium]
MHDPLVDGVQPGMDDDDFTIESAREAAARDELEQWVTAFLRSPGSDNAELADILSGEMQCWTGPVELPFDDLNRLAGPPDQPTLGRLDEDGVEKAEGMQDSIEDGWSPAPLVVSIRDGQMVVEDGNHRIEGLRRAGNTAYWAVVGFADSDERDRFAARSEERTMSENTPDTKGPDGTEYDEKATEDAHRRMTGGSQDT